MGTRHHARGFVTLAVALILAVAGVAPAQAVEEFENTPAPQVTGKAELGTWLKAEAPVWEPEASFTYEWRRDGEPIAGATSPDYKITRADLGHTLKLKVTSSRDGYQNATRYSKDFGPVQLRSMSEPKFIHVDGSRLVGTHLRAYGSVWPRDAQLTVQWLKDGVEFHRGDFYRVTPEDEFDTIEVIFTFTKPGFADTVVRREVFLSPYPGMPDFGLKGQVRVNERVCVTPYSAGAPDFEVTARWKLDGAYIGSAASRCHTPTPADAGKQLSVVVAAEPVVRQAHRPEAKFFLNANAQVRKGIMGEWFTPRLWMNPKRARLVVTEPGTVDSRQYQWLRDGEPIQGETRKYYAPGAADAGKDLSVRVTLKKKGFYTRVETLEWDFS